MTLTPEQLEVRRSGVCASDVAAIVGLSPYATVHDVFVEKLALAPPDEPTIAMRLGNVVEPFLAQLYSEREGVELAGPFGTLQHPDLPWVLATPDRAHATPVPAERFACLVELKLVGWRVADTWDADEHEEGIPDFVRCQVAWQMAACDSERADVCALIGTEAVRVYTVRRHRGLEDRLLALCGEFWHEHVSQRRPPPVDASESARRMLEAIYRDQPPPAELRATIELESWVDSYIAATEQAAAAKEAKALATHHIAEALGAAVADTLISARGRAYWRRAKGNTNRTFRFIEPKKKEPTT